LRRLSSASDCIPCALIGQHKENAMTTKARPGNQPDSKDMAAPFDKDGESTDSAQTGATPEDAEEEAAKLGDFA
jgi:hypothetical protein